MTSWDSIPERFEKIVETYPDHLAIKQKDCSVTYDELNKAANRIGGGILKALGSGNEPSRLLLQAYNVRAFTLALLSFPLEQLAFCRKNLESG